MRPLIAIVGVVLSLALSAAPAEAQPEARDGTWWTGLDISDVSDIQKLTLNMFTRTWYIRGLIEGAFGLSRDMLNAGLDGAALDPESGARVEAAYLRAVSRHVTNVTIGQVSDGLDVFYRDFRNRRIAVPMAVTVVLLEIAGTSQDRIASRTEALRRNATEPATPAPPR